MSRVAFFSPLPPQPTGIALYNGRLLPPLARHVDITLFHGRPDAVDAAIRRQFEIRPLASFAGPLTDGFDLCLYHMGNNITYHRAIYETALRHPGLLTLHDSNLHSFYGELYLRQGQFADYTRQMAYGYGRSGLNAARRAHHEQARYPAATMPLFQRLVDRSLGVVVHSRFAQQQVASPTFWSPPTPVRHIPLHQPDLTPTLPAPAAAKAQLGYAPESLLLASFGYVSPNKRIDSVLTAVAGLRLQLPQLRYALVGKVVEGYDIEAQAAEMGLADVVRFVGYADDATFDRYLAATDVGVNLRYPSAGETSATLLTLLAAGKPVLVSNAGSLAEMPTDCAVKIDVDENEVAQLTAVIQSLATDPAKRQQMGETAVAIIRHQHQPETAAAAYADFIDYLITFPEAQKFPGRYNQP